METSSDILYLNNALSKFNIDSSRWNIFLISSPNHFPWANFKLNQNPKLHLQKSNNKQLNIRCESIFSQNSKVLRYFLPQYNYLIVSNNQYESVTHSDCVTLNYRCHNWSNEATAKIIRIRLNSLREGGNTDVGY